MEVYLTGIMPPETSFKGVKFKAAHYAVMPVLVVRDFERKLMNFCLFLYLTVIFCSFLLQSSALAPAQEKPWLRLVLFSVDPATHPPATHPPVKVYLQTVNTSYRYNIILTGRRVYRKTTSKEDNLKGRRPKRKITT